MDGVPVAWWVWRRLRWARRRGWTGMVISGYRSPAQQRAAAQEYSRRVGVPIERLYPQGVLASNHVGRRFPRGAVDVTNPAQLQRCMRQWAAEGKRYPLMGNGAVLRNDPAHFSLRGR